MAKYRKLGRRSDLRKAVKKPGNSSFKSWKDQNNRSKGKRDPKDC